MLDKLNYLRDKVGVILILTQDIELLLYCLLFLVEELKLFVTLFVNSVDCLSALFL